MEQMELALKNAKAKTERHLKWHEKQYGSGMIFGIQIGWMLGIATAVPVYFLAKFVVCIISAS